jgi:hypothetical protein
VPIAKLLACSNLLLSPKAKIQGNDQICIPRARRALRDEVAATVTLTWRDHLILVARAQRKFLLMSANRYVERLPHIGLGRARPTGLAPEFRPTDQPCALRDEKKTRRR